MRQSDLPLTRALLNLRGLPSLIAGEPLIPRGDTRVIDTMLEIGFMALGESEHELVLGTTGQFWRTTSRPRALEDAGAFLTFAEPGHAKAVMDFRALPDGPGCVVTTETRVLGTDAEARRRFMRYWRLIAAGGGVIRHEMLAAVARRAERS